METQLVSIFFEGGRLDGSIDLVLRMEDCTRLSQSIGPVKEYEILELAQSNNVLVPEPLFVDDTGTIFNKPSFFMKYISGAATSQPKSWDHDPYNETPSLTQKIGGQLAKIHNITLDRRELDLLHPRSQVASTDYFSQQLDQLPTSLPTIEWAIRWLKKYQQKPIHKTLCHGDFRNGNIMRDNKILTGIIDWEFAYQGDPLEDLGWFCARCWRLGNDEKKAGGIGDLEDLIKGYEKEAKMKVDWSMLPYWEINATVHWAIIAHQQGFRYSNDPKKNLELALTAVKAVEIESDILDQIHKFECQ